MITKISILFKPASMKHGRAGIICKKMLKLSQNIFSKISFGILSARRGQWEMPPESSIKFLAIAAASSCSCYWQEISPQTNPSTML
jgi:hypothetical protein